MAFEHGLTGVATLIFTQYFYMWNVKHQLMYLWNIETCTEIRNYFSIITSSFLLYIFVDCSEENPVYTWYKFSCHLTEAFHVLYNAQLDKKCDIFLKE